MSISSPLDLPNLLAWYSADHIASLGAADNSDIAAWTDLSGNGHHLTATVGSGGPKFRTAGGPAGGTGRRVQFTGQPSGGYFTGPNMWGANASGVGIASGEVMGTILSVTDGSNPSPSPWSIGQASGANEAHYPHSPAGANYIYEHWGTTSRPNGTSSVAINVWRRINIWSAPNDWKMQLDETAIGAWATLVANTVRWDGAFLIGRGRNGVAPDVRFPGSIGCLVFLDAKATTGERADLVAWLTANPSGGLVPSPPGVPTAVTVTDFSTTTADLSWGAPASGGAPTGYEVRVDAGAGTADPASPHTFTGLTPSTSYTVGVRAVNGAGSSAWVDVAVTTLDPPPPGYYRVELDLGAHSWDVESLDSPALGMPSLPLSLGWDIPDSVESFPAQPDLQTLSFAVRVSDASDLADVVKGTTVSLRMYVDNDPGAPAWQTFDGVVTQLDGETLPSIDPDADETARDFRATVYCAEDTARLGDIYVGYTVDWPIESIDDRVDRICTEAGVTYAAGMALGTGREGWLPARPVGAAVSALEALRQALKDAADEYDSEPPDVYYGRYVFRYTHADTTVRLYAMRRRMFAGSTSNTTLAGGLVHARGAQWTKQPGAEASDWVIVDGTVFGTPGAGVPYVRNTGLLDYFGDPPGSETNWSAVTRDNLGNALLPDGSTALDGWASRVLRYAAYVDPEPVALWASGAPLTPRAVVIEPLSPELEVNAVDYLAGMLTGARLVIAPGGRFYIDVRLRAELLAGAETP